jgi:hypothetical protein
VIMPPIIGAAMRFITSAPACQVGDHDGQQAKKNRADCHDLGPAAPQRSLIELMRPSARYFSQA